MISAPYEPEGTPRTRRGGRRALGAVAAAALLGGALAGPAFSAEPPSAAAELVVNGDFSDATGAPWWWTEDNPGTVVDGVLCADVPGGTTNPWDAIIGQDDIALVAGQEYTLSYTASASVAATITVNVQEAVEPYEQQFTSQDALTETAEPITHTFTATADDPAAQLAFQIGGSADPYTFCLDDVSLTDGEA
ncbi:carbohydrate binding domain-containing protein [Streptomyces johnsoniae]|uniref:Carbohydrate binding domain-containing protein n=1 Tax=Streptomyces johnsoniae TaxID=3075532 RepID=A0ABU2SCA7_9ACTN|nr:carbohydrate binding domain-containing protein [Streptomyces sp. DSM 41886]MDT0446448.1 carbohydrate binding domain-containing protein [Streptomyces sp. DSM 41886]